MDSEYYERKARDEDKKVNEATKKRADAEKKKADAESAVHKAERAAAKASSSSSRDSKLREADRKRSDVVKFGKEIAKHTDAAATAQGKAADHRKKAAAERERDRKTAERKAKDAARRNEREAREAKRRADTAERARDSEIGDLRTRTDGIAAQLAQSKAAAPKQMTVLFLAGTIDGGEAPLHLDREIHEVTKKVRSSEHREHVQIESVQAARISDIIDALNEHQPDVVHFSGHGNQEVLLFEGPNGVPQELRAEHMALLLQATSKQIRMVVFNACESAEQAEAATTFAEFAIGMDQPIDDDAAKDFAGQLYGSLASGMSVDLAFRQAVAHASAVQGDESAVGTPNLYVQPGATAEGTVLVSGA